MYRSQENQLEGSVKYRIKYGSRMGVSRMMLRVK